MYNQNKRKSIRLKEYDYTKEGIYFITICIKNRQQLLGEIINNQIQLNKKGRIIEKELINTINKLKYCNIKIYQIMPDHIHFILEIKNENIIKLGDVVRYYKGRTSSKTKIYWQRNYYEHIIRNEKEYNKIYEYIINNPSNWCKDNK